MSRAEHLHAFETGAKYQEYVSALYEDWRNRVDATEDFDEWKVAEIRHLRTEVTRLTHATVEQYNAGRASMAGELDVATRAASDAHNLANQAQQTIAALRAENQRLQREDGTYKADFDRTFNVGDECVVVPAGKSLFEEQLRVNRYNAEIVNESNRVITDLQARVTAAEARVRELREALNRFDDAIGTSWDCECGRIEYDDSKECQECGRERPSVNGVMHAARALLAEKGE